MMKSSWRSICLLVLTIVVTFCSARTEHQYCVIGAGPSGLQLGYFLQRAGRDYVIIERAAVAGSFYLRYPRHRTLISINKRFTGSTNKEFNFRHDWNSLISDDDSLQMRHYSKDYFPSADSYVKYLQDFAEKLKLNIQYNSEIVSVAREKSDGATTGKFVLENSNGTLYHCGIVVVSTGMWKPNIPEGFPGIEHAEGYESVSVDPEDFEGQTVLIIGRGNSGFEIAANIVGSAAFIHMTSRSRIKLAFQTHYVGDLRAVNDALIDTYQLKSLDGLFESELGLENQAIVEKGNTLHLVLNQEFEGIDQEMRDKLPDNLGFRSSYDRIIRCMGFKFDFSIFTSSAQPDRSPVGEYDKYPNLLSNYESSSVRDMFFAGVVTHSLDYRKSAGGFIHGFRYTARALFKHMEWRYHGVPWPSVSLSPVDLVSHFVKRINEASLQYIAEKPWGSVGFARYSVCASSFPWDMDVFVVTLSVYTPDAFHATDAPQMLFHTKAPTKGIYQMFNMLADVAVIGEDNMIDYLEEVPIASLHMLKEMTGHEGQRLIILNMQYGANYSGPGKDVLSEDRAIGDPSSADKSNFLHPVLYYYSEPIERVFLEDIPKADSYHHVVEDFETNWTARRGHIIPLRRFIESVFDVDLRCFPTEICFEYVLTHGSNVPPCCKQYYSHGAQTVGAARFNATLAELFQSNTVNV